MTRPSIRGVLPIVGVALAIAVIATAFQWTRSSGAPSDSSEATGTQSTASAVAPVEDPQTSSSGAAVPPSKPTQSPPGTQPPSGAPVAPDKPVKPGTELQQLTAPPERSLWALPAGSLGADIEVAVEFEPYGIGPSSFGPSIVALVTSAKPADPAADFPDITGRNVVFLVGDTVVDKGGRYSGTAVTRVQDDRVVLVLEEVRPVP